MSSDPEANIKKEQKAQPARAGFTDQQKFYDSGRNFGHDAIDARLANVISFVRRSIKGDWAQQRVLDVGCANGMVLRSLPDALSKVGLDASSVLLDRSREHGIEVHHCDFDNNPFPLPSESFDVVLCHDVIEHVLHTDHLLNEINRVLRPGGWLNLSVPNINQPVSLISQLFLDLTPPFAARYRCTHYRDFTLRLSKGMLRAHGFSIIRAEGSYVFPFANSRLSKWIARLAPRWGAHHFFLAEKKIGKTIPEDFACDMPELLGWLKKESSAG